MIVRMLLAAATLLALPQAAIARCTLQTVSVPGNVVTVTYDPFDSTVLSQPIQISLTGSDCNGTVFINLLDDPSYPGALAGSALRIGSPPNQLQAVLTDSGPGQGNNGFFLATVASGASLQLTIPRGQRVAPGEYVVRIGLRAAENQGSGTDGVTNSLEIRVLVDASVGLAAARGTSLNLGELVPGTTATQPVTFHAYSNTGYQLTLTTDFGLRLRLDPQQAQPSVPYTLTLDTAPLASVPAAIPFMNPGQVGFREHALNAVVGVMTSVPAGTYRDYITIEISPPAGGH